MHQKNFALIGAAGYVAPKHLKAIKDTDNSLIVACDKHDSVGVIDSYFPEASFFTEFERFDRFLEKQRHAGSGNAVDYVSICSPNYLHDAHCRLALRVGANAICEKPLVINPWNLDQLVELEQIHGKRVYNVLQLRHLESVIKMKEQFADYSAGEKKEICLTYITRRGKWYEHSWKGDDARSGGLPLNIGVHFFDFLSWVFGGVESSELHLSEPNRCSGVMELEKARVRWFLSIVESDLPDSVLESGGYAYRSVTCDDEELDLSQGFTELHTKVYQSILDGNGYGIDEARNAVEIVHQLRNTEVVSPGKTAHPLMLKG